MLSGLNPALHHSSPLNMQIFASQVKTNKIAANNLNFQMLLQIRNLQQSIGLKGKPIMKLLQGVFVKLSKFPPLITLFCSISFLELEIQATKEEAPQSNKTESLETREKRRNLISS